MAFEKKMGENSNQMSVDLGSIFVPKTISNILKEVSKMEDFYSKSSRLDFYIHSLDEEMKKIDAFKRELPLCMHLLKDAIERLKEEKLQLNGNFEGGVGAKGSIDFIEKKKWMSSAQLWSTPIQYENKNQDSFFTKKSRYEEEKGSGSQVVGCNLKNKTGAFMPFKKPSGVTIKEDKRVDPVHGGLSLSIPVADVEPIDHRSVKENRGLVRPQLHQPQDQQQQRKQRRCWSPELHKLFVDALQLLGGPHTATPKQIRELMKVDGLTNDEVKSHLQKYRIHIRKLPGGSSNLSWMNDPVAFSGSPQDHLDLGGSAKGGSGVGGDSMEEDDDEKFESQSFMGRAVEYRV